MTSVAWYAVLLALVAAERLVELRLSRRNLTWSLARGGTETGGVHFRVMTTVHALFLPACLLEVWLLGRPFVPGLAVPMIALAVAAQALRWWAIGTLGPRWNVRVVAIPGEPAVAGGPYRWVRHPNYVAVVAEFIAIPLIHTAWLTAALFSALNVPLLVTRIRCEERMLAALADYEERLPAARFVPRMR